MSLEMKYFVLKPKAKNLSDPYAAASQAAMQTYAACIWETDQEHARSLAEWSRNECIAQARLTAGEED